MKILSVVCLLAIAVALAAEMPLIQPPELVAQLKKVGAKPVLLHVGFPRFWRQKRIPGTVYAGPGNTPEGIANLRAVVAKYPKNANLVIYCGCCPWDHCPNIKPALEVLRQMGYTSVKALNIPTNISADWYEKGYPADATPISR
jgi:thiosulfate/3-mercaptopyruvate sulfurtransferase